MAERLVFSTGVHASAKGEDLASVASRLSNEDLAFWQKRLQEMGVLPHEPGILDAEARRRGIEDWNFGPLFQKGVSVGSEQQD
jgi:hypothetical protein